MMKCSKMKLLALMLCLLLGAVTMLGACGGSGENAAGGGGGGSLADLYKLYKDVAAKMEGADSVAMDYEMDIAMDFMGQSVEMKGTGDIVVVRNSATDVQMKMGMAMQAEALGEQEITTSTYFKDGIMYMDAMGQKIQLATDVKDALNQSNAELLEFEENAVLEASSEKTAEGTLVKMAIDGKAVEALMQDRLQNMTGGLSGGGTVSIGTINLELLVDKDNNILSYRMLMDMNTPTGAEETDADAEEAAAGTEMAMS
ncbi:MAG: hypothetical protein LBD12_01370, partial [Clostridiales Family XIII bacterium]|nr:hypothetical protein [Clostridiales Family XIII bacterium]